MATDQKRRTPGVCLRLCHAIRNILGVADTPRTGSDHDGGGRNKDTYKVGIRTLPRAAAHRTKVSELVSIGKYDNVMYVTM